MGGHAIPVAPPPACPRCGRPSPPAADHFPDVAACPEHGPFRVRDGAMMRREAVTLRDGTRATTYSYPEG